MTEGADAFAPEELAALEGREFAVCVATFYEDLAERLLNGAADRRAAHAVIPRRPALVRPSAACLP